MFSAIFPPYEVYGSMLLELMEKIQKFGNNLLFIVLNDKNITTLEVGDFRNLREEVLRSLKANDFKKSDIHVFLVNPATKEVSSCSFSEYGDFLNDDKTSKELFSFITSGKIKISRYLKFIHHLREIKVMPFYFSHQNRKPRNG